MVAAHSTPAGLGATVADFISTAVPVTTWDSFHSAGTGGDRSGTTTPTYATGLAVGPRQADGSLPVLDFLRLAPGSHVIDAGVNVEYAYAAAGEGSATATLVLGVDDAPRAATAAGL